MPRLVAALMRHGHYEQPEKTPSAHLPYPLTEKGRSQAEAAAEEVAAFAASKGWVLDGVIETSQLLRAWETGTIISGIWSRRFERPFRVVESDGLAERGVGAAANLTESEITVIVERDPRHHLPPNWRLDSQIRLPFPGAESLMDAGARVLQHLDRRTATLSREIETDTVRLYIGHGGSIRHAAIHAGILRLEDMPRLSMENCGTVYFEKADGVWAHIDGAWKPRNKRPATD